MPSADRRIALRIDVDFQVGLRRAVPFFLEALAEVEMHATFFVVAGRNRPRSSAARIFRSGYLRRLRRLGIRDVATMLVRSFQEPEGFLDSDAAQEALAAIRDRGHEIAVHGFDHAWWADNVWRSDESRLRDEIEQAYETMERSTGIAGLAWGSPSWRTTGPVLDVLARRGVPYFSECWGRAPFRTADVSEAASHVPHLPINLPSLESSILDDWLSEEEAVSKLFAERADGNLSVACFHDYFEGLLRPQLFRRFLKECSRRKLRTITLQDAAEALGDSDEALPMHRLTRAPLSGFDGEVSWQQPGPCP